MPWPNYGYLVCAGIRRLLFKVEQDSVRPAGCTAAEFKAWPAADASVLHLAASSAPADVAAGLNTAGGGKMEDQQSKSVVSLTAKAV